MTKLKNLGEWSIEKNKFFHCREKGWVAALDLDQNNIEDDDRQLW